MIIRSPRVRPGKSVFSEATKDAYPFQQLFTAVAELCGLKDKVLATGYELPDIAMVDDDSDDDADDEGEDDRQGGEA
jgi:hypothetical protein